MLTGARRAVKRIRAFEIFDCGFAMRGAGLPHVRSETSDSAWRARRWGSAVTTSAVRRLADCATFYLWMRRETRKAARPTSTPATASAA